MNTLELPAELKKGAGTPLSEERKSG